MNKHLLRSLLFLILFFFLSGCAAIRFSFKKKAEENSALDLVLDSLFLERSDLKIKLAPPLDDPFLLSSIPFFLGSPVQMISFAEEVENTFQGLRGLSSKIAYCAKMLELPMQEITLEEQTDSSFTSNILIIYNALLHAEDLFDDAFSELGPDEMRFLKDKIEQLLFHGRHQENLTRKESQDLIEEAFLMAAKIDMEKIAEACFLVALAIENTMPELKNKTIDSIDETVLQAPLGNIIIGSMGDDIYDGDMPLILIEPGGDDTYSFKNHSVFSVIVDISGDDTYESSNNSFLASGIMGLGFLIDIEGDDLYQGENFSFGCGFMGAGVLSDLKGDDSYISQAFSQGAAALGIGLLHDENGDDFYQCGLYGQGMGYVGGAGVLTDIRGDDIFAAGSVVPDSREETGAFQTYSQGYGLGCRLFASGGVGILFNGEGSDIYKGSYFCQGSSYWHALGMLLDAKGDDQYIARRYSQGTGIHSSLGFLLDSFGDDVYSSWGVSQGCGHDLSVGILYDKQGNDLYNAEWLSQGAGNSTGIGLLIDEKGDDTFKAGSNITIQGSGVYDQRRDTESIGILIDREGHDVFSESPAMGKIWKRGEIGGGIDHSGELISVWSEPFKDNFIKNKSCTIDSTPKKYAGSWEKWLLPELENRLFSEESWNKAAKSLAEKGPIIIPSLMKYLEIKNVPIKRTVEDALKKMGIKYLTDIQDYLLEKKTETSEKKFLLYVLGDIQNKKSKEVFTRFLNHQSSSVQAMALRGLYKIEEPPPLDLSEKLHKSKSSKLKRYLCLSLKSSDDPKALKLLAEMLTDDDFQVRHAAYNVLKEKKDAALPFLKELKLKTHLSPTVCRMADDIAGFEIKE